jgi:hypothetical protein
MGFGANDGSLKLENGVHGKGCKNLDVHDGDVNGVEPSKNLFPVRNLPILHPSLKVKEKEETPDPDMLGLEEELPGWHGYVEWEKYPEKKKKIKEFMKKFEFPPVSLRFVNDSLLPGKSGTVTDKRNIQAPEFQLVPLPDTNPILEGVRYGDFSIENLLSISRGTSSQCPSIIKNKTDLVGLSDGNSIITHLERH